MQPVAAISRTMPSQKFVFIISGRSNSFSGGIYEHYPTRNQCTRLEARPLKNPQYNSPAPTSQANPDSPNRSASPENDLRWRIKAGSYGQLQCGNSRIPSEHADYCPGFGAFSASPDGVCFRTFFHTQTTTNIQPFIGARRKEKIMGRLAFCGRRVR